MGKSSCTVRGDLRRSSKIHIQCSSSHSSGWVVDCWCRKFNTHWQQIHQRTHWCLLDGWYHTLSLDGRDGQHEMDTKKPYAILEPVHTAGEDEEINAQDEGFFGSFNMHDMHQDLFGIRQSQSKSVEKFLELVLANSVLGCDGERKLPNKVHKALKAFLRYVIVYRSTFTCHVDAQLCRYIVRWWRRSTTHWTSLYWPCPRTWWTYDLKGS